jgi:hydroxyacid-oxoacid transhydrogenase
MEYDYAFEMAASSIRFGPGTTLELGMDLADQGVKRVMVLTDPYLRIPSRGKR